MMTNLVAQLREWRGVGSDVANLAAEEIERLSLLVEELEDVVLKAASRAVEPKCATCGATFVRIGDGYAPICVCASKAAVQVEPTADPPCKMNGACSTAASVRVMCWPCQIRWHRATAQTLEDSLRAGEKPPRIEPRGEENRT